MFAYSGPVVGVETKVVPAKLELSAREPDILIGVVVIQDRSQFRVGENAPAYSSQQMSLWQISRWALVLTVHQGRRHSRHWPVT